MQAVMGRSRSELRLRVEGLNLGFRIATPAPNLGALIIRIGLLGVHYYNSGKI